MTLPRRAARRILRAMTVRSPMRLLCGVLLGAMFAWPAAAQIPGQLPVCPWTMNGFTTRCQCWGPGNGPVWGSGVYAGESSICAAARHAGVIGEEGGAVRIIPLAGMANYQGSYRNGITSQDKGSSQRSFRVERGAQPWATPQPR